MQARACTSRLGLNRGYVSSGEIASDAESKTLTAARIRKETALSQLRELQLAEREGKLLDAGQVEAQWAQMLVAIRDAVLRLPAHDSAGPDADRCCPYGQKTRTIEI